MSGEQNPIPLPPVPHPDVIANHIQMHSDAIDLHKKQISVLRRQLKYSCEFHDIPWLDPSVKPRKAKV